MAGAFDYDALEKKLEMRSAPISAIKLKAMAMKLRHNTLGYRFKRGTGGPSGNLSEPLMPPGGRRSPSKGSSQEGSDGKQVQEMERPDNLVALKGMFLHPLSVLLLCVPLGISAPFIGLSNGWIFWLNFLALVPLAKILGDATEELAASLQNDTLSGLLNATFGNAVEMIVAIQSIRANLLSVVKASLLGSVLSNILLVLGSSFFLGGLSPSTRKRGPFHSFKGSFAPDLGGRLIGLEKEQKFPVKSALISLAMLLFAIMTIVLPTLFNTMEDNSKGYVLQVSRVGATITMSSYVMYLIFQLITHSVTLAIEDKMANTKSAEGSGTGQNKDVQVEQQAQALALFEDDDDDDDEEESASLEAWCAITLMAASTLVVAINSELLVDSIQDVAEKSGIPMGFIGVILLPIAGNACEHASALRFAMRDRPGLAIGIAVGSSTQVALLVVPFSVLVAQLLGKPMDLDFGALNSAVVTFSVLVVLVLLLDGRSNWFKGYVLIAMYIFIAALYWYMPPGFGAEVEV